MTRLAEEVATASFRQMQDKVSSDLSVLGSYYCEKQEAADRSVPWVAFTCVVVVQAVGHTTIQVESKKVNMPVELRETWISSTWLSGMREVAKRFRSTWRFANGISS